MLLPKLLRQKNIFLLGYLFTNNKNTVLYKISPALPDIISKYYISIFLPYSLAPCVLNSFPIYPNYNVIWLITQTVQTFENSNVQHVEKLSNSNII